jgi:hypothetical protein
MTLLSHHHIYLADPPGTTPGPLDYDGTTIPKRQMVVLMQEKRDGKPYAHIFERVELSVPPKPL